MIRGALDGVLELINSLGPLMISLIVLGVFASHYMGWTSYTWNDADNRLVETLATLVVGYWVGSSHGSAMKQKNIIEGDKR